MARFIGKVGYVEAQENPSGSGVWVDEVTEKEYQGSVERNTRALDNNDSKVNADISVNNRISVVADEYAEQHFFAIKYVDWAGVKWTVTSVEVVRPRLILNIGSVYNGPTS